VQNSKEITIDNYNMENNGRNIRAKFLIQQQPLAIS